MSAEELLQSFEKALQCDNWGQKLEAVSEYDKLNNLYYQNRHGLKMTQELQDELEEILDQTVQRASYLRGASRPSLACSLDEMRQQLDGIV